MIAIEGHVVVIYLGFLQPKKSGEQAIFGRPSSKIALMRSRSATLAKCFHIRCARVPALLHPIVTVGAFTKWGLDFMDCNPASAGGHHHIILAVDYFTKWAEAMPIVKYDSETAVHFIFNQIITWFGILKALVTYHGRKFQNKMM